MKYLFPLFLLLFACTDPLPPIDSSNSDQIRLNQIGYYPDAVKKAIVLDSTTTNTFKLVNTDNMREVFSGNLSAPIKWEIAGQQVQVADFSTFQEAGSYVIYIPKTGYSYPFEIKDHILEDAFKASVKGFYYLRMSTALEEEHAGQWSRAMAHPDDNILYHPSSGYTNGAKSSPGGWYDAGDYNKYVVNGAFSLGQLILLQEHAPQIIKDNSLNIPESGNGKSDLLDEIKYEMDWLLTMQDEDGGCFHKVTAKGFEPMVMPDSALSQRYMVGKGTGATLDFAACAAKASHSFRDYDSAYADLLLASAERAWKWAEQNPAVVYKNPEDIRTGEYGDSNFEQELAWAAAELYAVTGAQKYLEAFVAVPRKFELSSGDTWTSFMRYMGYFALLDRAGDLPQDLRTELTNGIQTEAQRINNKIQRNDYFQPAESFKWGSNSDLLSACMVLAMANRLNPNKDHVQSIRQTIDYIFGKNAVGYSFLTGFGDKTPMHIHHRQSAADNISAPVPGLVSGGPNIDRQDIEYVDTYPDNMFPMQSWADHEGSYASNEICLNWNAPLAYVLGYLESL